MSATEPIVDDYFAGDSGVDRGRRMLRWTRHPHKRAAILDREAEREEHRARLHTAVFGLDPHDRDGASAGQWLADSARLLRIVVQAERERADGPWMTPTYAQRLDDRTLELQVAVDVQLDEFVAGGPRRRLLRAMCGVWYPLTHGQAVGTIWTLPTGWWLR